MIHVLPLTMISVGRYGLIKMFPVHGLNYRHDLGAAESESSGATKRCTSDSKFRHAAESSLKSVEVVCRFPFFAHVLYYTFMVFISIIFLLFFLCQMGKNRFSYFKNYGGKG